MNNRQELLDAIHRRKPARIPYTYEARAETEARLRPHLRLRENQSIGDRFQCNHFDSLWTALGGGPALPERMKRLESKNPDVIYNYWGVKMQRIDTGAVSYFEIAENPLARAETVADIEKYDWPRPEEVVFPEIPKGVDLARWKKDRVISEGGYIGPFGIPWMMRGMEALMMDMVASPEIVAAIVAHVEHFTLGCLRIVLEKYPGAIDLISCGDDYGTQSGLMVSRRMIQRFFMPSLKRHYDLGRRHGATGYHHCCGAIFEMIPDFIDAGVQVLNPIQTSAIGMDPPKLKKEFGQDLCFHGGIDIQQTLVTGKPSDVRAEVRNRIDTLGPNGYILSPSHVLQPDAPPENIVAMYEEVRAYGARQ